MTKTTSTIRVFYDGACPLCRREVNLYQRLLVDKALTNKQNDVIDWVDISKNHGALEAECINYDDAMRLIHIKDGSGVHQVGLEGILTLWDTIPYYRAVSKLIRQLPIFHPLFARFYEYFAKHRMAFTGRRK